MTQLSIIYPYYKNKIMLLHHLGVWTAWPSHIRQQVELIVVDDGTPDPSLWAARAVSPFDLSGLALRVYRILEDKPWNHPMARNLGAAAARGEWLLIIDMDHVIPEAAITRILEMEKQPGRYYTFGRLKVKQLSPLKTEVRDGSHCIYAIRKADFQAVGGMDEDFCGHYGCEDAWFQRRAAGRIERVHCDDIKLLVFNVLDAAAPIPDAQDLSRARNKKHNQRLLRKKISGEIPGGGPILRLPWEQAL